MPKETQNAKAPTHQNASDDTTGTIHSKVTDQQPARQQTTRRGLLRRTAVLATGGLVAACSDESKQDTPGAPAVLKKQRNLKMVTSWPRNFPGLGTGAQRVADRITALSDGRISVEVNPAGELVGAFGVFDAVSRGFADMYHSGEYYFQGFSPAFNFFAAVPMGMTAPEMAAWIRYSGGQELWDELSGGYNIKPFMAGNSGTQMGGWFKKVLNTADDLKGLRIRMPGLGGEVFRRLGATPITLPGGEIFQSLDRGAIDATEWVGPWNDEQFGFQNIVKNYYYPGIHEPGTTLSLGMNKTLWDDMSDQDKAIVQAATDAENDVMLSEYNANNAAALNRLVAQHNVQVRPFPKPILDALATVSAEVIRDAANKDDISKRVFDSFRAARTNSMRWGEIAEQAFSAARINTSGDTSADK